MLTLFTLTNKITFVGPHIDKLCHLIFVQSSYMLYCLAYTLFTHERVRSECIFTKFVVNKACNLHICQNINATLWVCLLKTCVLRQAPVKLLFDLAVDISLGLFKNRGWIFYAGCHNNITAQLLLKPSIIILLAKTTSWLRSLSGL